MTNSEKLAATTAADFGYLAAMEVVHECEAAGKDGIARSTRRKRLVDVLRDAAAKTGITVGEDGGAPVVPAAAHPGWGPVLPMVPFCPPPAALSSAAGAVRAALGAVAAAPDPKGTIGQAAAGAARAEGLEEAMDLVALAPHVVALAAAVAAAEADAADAEAVYRVAQAQVTRSSMEAGATHSSASHLDLTIYCE